MPITASARMASRPRSRPSRACGGAPDALAAAVPGEARMCWFMTDCLLVQVHGSSCFQSTPAGVVGTYALFDTPAICCRLAIVPRWLQTTAAQIELRSRSTQNHVEYALTCTSWR